MVTIKSKTYDGVWYIECSVELPSGTRSGVEVISRSEQATEVELKAAVLAAYK
jgi:hypothetical protein